MKAFVAKLAKNEEGLIISAELVLVLTITVLGMVVGLSCVQQAVVAEFQDLAGAFRSLNQSFSTPTMLGCRKWFGPTSYRMGSRFTDGFFGAGIVNAGAVQAFSDSTTVVSNFDERGTVVSSPCVTERVQTDAIPHEKVQTGIACPPTITTPTPIVQPCPQPVIQPAVPCQSCTPGNATLTPIPNP